MQRWPETKRLLGLLVNSSGGAHARNARRLVHAARKQDRRLSAALLAAALAHTPEAEEVAARRAHAHGAQAERAGARAAAQLPQGPPRPSPPAQERGQEGARGRGGCEATEATNGRRLRPTPLPPRDDDGAGDENGASDAAEEIERAAAELNGARSAEDEVADLFAEQQELGEGDLEGYSVDE